MQTGKSVRAVAQAPSFELPQIDVRRFGTHAALFAFCLLSALLLTASRLEITKLHYQLSDLHRQRQAMLADVERLRVEARALGSPRRIEKLARDAGFTYPDRDSVVVLDE